SVAAGKVIKTPLASPAAILPWPTEEGFFYSDAAAALAKLISKDCGFARMRVQEPGLPRDCRLLAHILLHSVATWALSCAICGTGIIDMTAKFREPGATTTRRAALLGASALALSAAGLRAQEAKKGGTLNFMQNSEPQTLVALTTTATPVLTV